MTRWIVALLLVVGLLAIRTAGAAGALTALRNLPLAECGIAPGDTRHWRANRLLDEAAQRWARGADANEAVERGDYTATAVSGLHFYGPDSVQGPHLNAASCRVLRNRALHDVGAFRRQDELWILLAARAVLPGPADRTIVARRVLALVNEARSKGHRCGDKDWPPIDPVRLSATLSNVAAQHAQDMADHHYFDHRDLGGRSPADRVREAGYREQLAGENIAYGKLSADDAIAGWLKSPEHCENVMEARFREMGVAYAEDRGGHRGLYWVQLFAEPRGEPDHRVRRRTNDLWHLLRRRPPPDQHISTHAQPDDIEHRGGECPVVGAVDEHAGGAQNIDELIHRGACAKPA